MRQWQNAKRPTLEVHDTTADFKFGKDCVKLNFEDRFEPVARCRRSGLSTCSVMPLSRVADSASVSLSNDSVEVAPGISVTPHNVTVSFKKKQEKVWDSLPGMGSMCWRDLPRRLVPRVHA